MRDRARERKGTVLYGKRKGYLWEIDLLGGAGKGDIGETGIDRPDLPMNVLENSAIHVR
jgi:hypothetical protein